MTAKVTTKRQLTKALKEFDTSCPLDEEAQGICTMSAEVLKDRLGGEVYGYFIVDNPNAVVGQTEEGHDFLVVDGFLVDWWYRSFYEGPGVYDLKKDAAEVERLYGPSSNWTTREHLALRHPTIACGDCFRWAVQQAQELEKQGLRPYVVHGLFHPRNQTVDHPTPHAWVEVGQGPNALVYDWQREVVHHLGPASLDDFYFQARPTRPRRYTVREALALSVRHGHWGPWA